MNGGTSILPCISAFRQTANMSQLLNIGAAHGSMMVTRLKFGTIRKTILKRFYQGMPMGIVRELTGLNKHHRLNITAIYVWMVVKTIAPSATKRQAMLVSVHTNDYYRFSLQKICNNTCWGWHPKPTDLGTICP